MSLVIEDLNPSRLHPSLPRFEIMSMLAERVAGSRESAGECSLALIATFKLGDCIDARSGIIGAGFMVI